MPETPAAPPVEEVDPRKRHGMNTVLSWLVQTLAFGLAFMPIAAQPVAPLAWVGLYLATALLAVLAAWWRWPRWPARTWLYACFCSLLLAASFWGANFALDALHGAARRKAEVTSTLGGLELWFVLCPGVASIAVSGLARSLLEGNARPSPITG